MNVNRRVLGALFVICRYLELVRMRGVWALGRGLKVQWPVGRSEFGRICIRAVASDSKHGCEAVERATDGAPRCCGSEGVASLCNTHSLQQGISHAPARPEARRSLSATCLPSRDRGPMLTSWSRVTTGQRWTKVARSSRFQVSYVVNGQYLGRL